MWNKVAGGLTLAVLLAVSSVASAAPEQAPTTPPTPPTPLSSVSPKAPAASAKRTTTQSHTATAAPVSTNALTPHALSVLRPGFDTTVFGPNDDGTYPCVSQTDDVPQNCTPTAIPIGFSINFFGHVYSSLYLNNNGNVTFDAPLSAFTPFPIISTSRVIIAPFFADVDTRVGNTASFGTGTVDGHQAWGATWAGVGCYDKTTVGTNVFQLVLIDRSDTGSGNFDIEFNEGQIQWESGQASGGDAACLGGSSARVGYSNGTDAAYELPGSAEPGAFLDSNTATGLISGEIGSDVPGRYVFPARNGYAPTPGSMPLLNEPVRLADTRQAGGGGPIGNSQARCFGVAGVGGVPSSATGVLLNVTAVGYNGPGWVTLYPAGQPVPSTSTLNFSPGAYAIANGVIARVGSNGQVCASVGTINNAPGSANVILDVTGYLTAASALQVPLLTQPQRLADTRIAGAGPIANGQSRCFTIAGQGAIPSDATGVLLNVTGVNYTTPGWLTVYPAGQPVPQTSTLDMDPHAYAIANGAIARIGTNGQVCVNFGTANNVQGASDVVLDATGYLTSVAFTAMPLLSQPQRLVDTRSLPAPFGGPISAGQSRCFVMTGVGGVPSSAVGVVVNLAAVDYTAPGWLTLYPAGQGVPPTSTLNFDRNEYAIANEAVVPLGTGNQLCVSFGTLNSVSGTTDVILDVVGYLTGLGS